MMNPARQGLALVLLGLLPACLEAEDCEQDGQSYTDGETWTAANCDVCECENGVTFCSAAECEDLGESGTDSGR
jgi:hypothetical protein